MIDSEEVCGKITGLLDSSGAEYKLFSHKPAFTYAELEQARKETGFFGTEGKCLVLKTGESFVVLVTIFSKKVDFNKVKEKLGISKIRLAAKEELKERFGAEPGCAYPFGFESEFGIFVDPEAYSQEWFLFSPAVPSRTVQVRGADLKKVFGSLPNRVSETGEFFFSEKPL